MDFVSVDHMTNFFHGLYGRFQDLLQLDTPRRRFLLVRGP